MITTVIAGDGDDILEGSEGSDIFDGGADTDICLDVSESETIRNCEG